MDIGSSKVLTRKTSSLNMQTGEVIEKEESVLLRTKKRERFMLLYVENFNAIVNLTKKSQEILAQILTKKVTFGTNEVVLDSVFRAELAEKLQSSRQVVANCVSELVDKKILKREKRAGGYVFFLNSYLFGQGEWNTIEKQRQQFTIDYDFVNYTAEKEIKTITAYEGLPDKEDIQIIKREKYRDEHGIERHDVLIDRKEKASIDVEAEDVEVLEESPKQIEMASRIEPVVLNNNGDEVALLREKNREKELNIKEFELKIKMKELELQEYKMKEKQGSLF
ncbi:MULTISPECIES: hypothetical protein [Helicobacter]|uniref:hypothetical protein n=1 Tax=Helicobacter TaxID=209 RepID=UPI00260AB234|nr:hypothetical protein [Helicobacter sp. UBA3407]